MTTLTELRKQKKQWLQSTIPRSDLKNKFKFTDQEITEIESEVKYGKERFGKEEVNKYIEEKVKNNKSTPLQPRNNCKQICPNCKNAVNKKFIGLTGICINCEKNKICQNSRKQNQIERSQRIKPKGNQMTI